MTAAQDRTGSLALWAMIVVLVCLAVFVICGSVLTRDYWVLGFIAALALGLVAGIACHEFGHMLCALLLTLPIRLISIGVGPLLWRGQIGETQLELRAIPSGGCVQCYPQPVVRKFSTLFILFGGVLGNVALIGLVAAVKKAGVLPDAWGDYLGAVVLVQFLFIVQVLMPFSTTVDGTRVGSDGWQLLRLVVGPWRGPTQAGLLYAAMLESYGANQAPLRRARPRLIYHLLRSDRSTDVEARRDFQDALQRELARGVLSREETMLALDALVTSGLIYRDPPPLHAHLDAWSRQALQLGPDIATLRGSRGAVLVELGRCQEGKALLIPLVGARLDKLFDVFMNSVFLARAEHALGNVAAARALAAAARENVEAIRAIPDAAYMLSRLDAELATPSKQPGGAAQSELCMLPRTASSASQP